MWDLSPSTSPWETTHRESPGTPIPGYSYCIGLHGQKRCHCQAKCRAATAGPELRGPLVHGCPSPVRSASHCVDCPVSGWSQPLFSACAWSAPINPVSRGEKDTNTTQIQRTLPVHTGLGRVQGTGLLRRCCPTGTRWELLGRHLGAGAKP